MKTPFICITFLTCFIGFHSRSAVIDGKTALPDLYWNTTNPIFLISNTDHIIDVNKATTAHQHDQINIVCPQYEPHTPPEIMERHVIYNVEKEEYDTCRILNPKPRIVAYCTEPLKERIFTISFRSFSPMPNTLEFHPGKSYYFISTSSGDDLHRRVGGYCTNNNMKVVFKVADKRSVISGKAKAVKLKSEMFSPKKQFQTSLTKPVNEPRVIQDGQFIPDKMLRDEESRTYSYSTKVTDTQESPNSIDRIIYRSDKQHPLESFDTHSASFTLNSFVPLTFIMFLI